MKAVCILIDVLLVAAVAYCGWRGFKNGIILGIISVAALMASLFVADIAANAYTPEIQGLLEPFSASLVDNAVSAITDYDPERTAAIQLGDDEEAPPALILTEEEKQDVYSVCYGACLQMGFAHGTSQETAKEVAGKIDVVCQDMNNLLGSILCRRAAYLLLFIVCFMLLAIILAAIGNVFNLVLALPRGAEIYDAMFGAVIGAVKGCLLLLVLGCMTRYLGLVIPDAIETGSGILKLITSANPIANIFGL